MTLSPRSSRLRVTLYSVTMFVLGAIVQLIGAKALVILLAGLALIVTALMIIELCSR